ncbi:MAG TPA: FtsW/RodA/SpoVE family cell cycle protein, partial [Acidobacteriaceae bacterium]|nr:FtsW/RodA/SpoVE family cell cycle protein [Acidobacteriaceae bacterium]
MAKRVGVDKWLFGTVLLLVLFGLVMVFSASAVMAKATTGSPYTFVIKQAAFTVAGLVALFLLMRVDYRKYNNPRLIFPAMGITGVLLLAVFVLHGKVNGAHRWIPLGPATLQPSELAKPIIVLFLAWFLQTRMHAIENVKDTILPAVIPPLVYILLILKEPDLGTAMVCAAVVMLMLYLAGMQIKWIAVAIAAAAPVLYYMLFHVAWRA